MTDARTPMKRVDYPELFFPPDKIVPPNVPPPSYAAGNSSVTTMCFAYNDTSTHLCGHAGELFAVPPPPGPSPATSALAQVPRAPSPRLPPSLSKYGRRTGVDVLQ